MKAAIFILLLTIQPGAYAQNDLTKKLMMGYQGWFLAQGDGSAPNEWRHWFKSTTTPSAAQLNVDMWPDMTEYTQTYATNMTYPNGTTARLYSAHDQSTTNTHFKWMKDYNVYGVYLQRFLGEAVNDNRFFQVRNNVLQNVINASQTYDRHFAMMYDISGVPDDGNLYTKLVTDWEYLVNTKNLTQQPGYVKQDGKPVIAIWGIGFRDRGLKPATFDSLINYFHTKAAPQYRAYIVGGVPGQWRTLDGDSESDPQWTNIYHSLDMISPWAVGRYGTNNEADNWKNNRVVPDLADCNTNSVDYMPVIWPGFSWFNIYGQPLNQIPRNGGNFYWRQAYNVISAGASFVYVAMFDEVDESTAMFKLAPNAASAPAQGSFVKLDADGYTLPSDWYLRLADQTQKMLDNTISLTNTIPISPSVPITPNVYIAASGPAIEGGVSGSFTISAGSLSSNITVGYTISGTASAADYNASPGLSGTVTLTPASPVATIIINALPDNITESAETLQLTISPGTGYAIGISTASLSIIASAPYNGTPMNIPGKVEIENYDTGGQGIAYNDNDVTNNGNQYRTTEGVDIENCSEGGYNAGWLANGEWLAYTVNVTVAGTYTLQARVATINSGKTFHVELNGINISGSIPVTNTGGWQTWQTVNITTPVLTTGPKLLRIVFDTGDFNLNFLNFNLVSALACSSSTIPFIATQPVAGNTYQWQVNSGSGYTNINNGLNYTGTTSDTLIISNAPTSWYGNQYRCAITNNQVISYGQECTLKFAAFWTGNSNTAWENTGNWSCNVLPDANTDVIINNGTVILNSSATVRSIVTRPGVMFTANTGFALSIVH